MDSIKVSCIIPVYNQGKYLAECLDSILNQTYKDYEVIIVNDGSMDNTLSVIMEYCDKIQNIILYSKASNEGLPKALNTGLKMCKGEYITWMSADSYYEPEAFEVMKKALDENKDCGLVSTGFRIFGNRESIEQHTPRKYSYEDMKIGNFVGACFLFRRRFIDEGLRFDPDFLCTEDWKFALDISLKTPILKIKGVYANWRDHSDNLTNTKGKDLGFINSARLIEKYKNVKGDY